VGRISWPEPESGQSETSHPQWVCLCPVKDRVLYAQHLADFLNDLQEIISLRLSFLKIVAVATVGDGTVRESVGYARFPTYDKVMIPGAEQR
jgi:hypothetical protein